MAGQTPTKAPVAKYCYRCGRGLDKGADRCLFCGAPARVTEKVRRCPFCDQLIREQAIKCQHCGEFLDGRETAPGGGQSVTFVIDKAVIGGAGEMTIPGGQSVPAEIASALPPETVHAIESGEPQMIDYPGVRALPAPEIIDMDPASPPVPYQRPSMLPAKRSPAPAPEPKKRKKARPPKIKKTAGPPTCHQCKVEVEDDDAYCFHCGAAFSKHAKKRQKRLTRTGGSKFAIWLAGAALIGAGYLRVSEQPSITVVGASALGALFGATALVKGKGLVMRVLGLVALLAATYLIYLSLIAGAETPPLPE